MIDAVQKERPSRGWVQHFHGKTIGPYDFIQAPHFIFLFGYWLTDWRVAPRFAFCVLFVCVSNDPIIDDDDDDGVVMYRICIGGLYESSGG